MRAERISPSWLSREPRNESAGEYMISPVSESATARCLRRTTAPGVCAASARRSGPRLDQVLEQRRVGLLDVRARDQDLEVGVAGDVAQLRAPQAGVERDADRAKPGGAVERRQRGMPIGSRTPTVSPSPTPSAASARANSNVASANCSNVRRTPPNTSASSSGHNAAARDVVGQGPAGAIRLGSTSSGGEFVEE